MLNIHLGFRENVTYLIWDTFFWSYEYKWFLNPLVQKILLDLDDVKFESPCWCYKHESTLIAPCYLSEEVMALILMIATEEEICIDICSPRTTKWILKIAEKKDVTVNVTDINNALYQLLKDKSGV